jgi:hypothetical protein
MCDQDVKREHDNITTDKSGCNFQEPLKGRTKGIFSAGIFYRLGNQ